MLELTKNRFEFTEENVQLFEVVSNDSYFIEIVINSLEILLLILSLIADYFIDISGFGELFYFRRTHFLFVVVSIFLESFFDHVETLFESDAVGVKEGITSGLDDLLILKFLFLIERG